MPQTNEFMTLSLKLRKHSIFVIDSYLKDCVFTAVKRNESSKKGMLKGYHSSIEGIRKGYLFREKYYAIK